MVERPARAPTVTFFSTDAFVPGATILLGDDAAQHAKVLRIGGGEPVALRNGCGMGAIGVLGRITRRSVTIDITDSWEIPAPAAVHMLIPVADRDRMLLLAEKCTELAATSWRPVVWRRSRSVRPAGDGPAFQARVRGRMIAALTQSGGGWLPEIHPSALVGRAIAAAPPGTRLLLDTAASSPLFGTILTAPVAIALGPEGGFESKERSELIDAGFSPVWLPGGTLRFETAAIAALALVRATLSTDEDRPAGNGGAGIEPPDAGETVDDGGEERE